MNATTKNLENYETFMARAGETVVERVVMCFPNPFEEMGELVRVNYTSNKWIDELKEQGKQTQEYFHDREQGEPIYVVRKVNEEEVEGKPFKRHSALHNSPAEYPNFGTIDSLVVRLRDGRLAEFDYEHRNPKPAFTCSPDRKMLFIQYFQDDDEVPNLYIFNATPREEDVMTEDGLIC